jgi:hypothetical protein
MKHIFSLIILVAISSFGGRVFAETSELKLRILPQDCIFDVIDVGTQQLFFHTPEACGVLIPPNQPAPNMPAGNSNLDSGYKTVQEIAKHENAQYNVGPLSFGYSPTKFFLLSFLGLQLRIEWSVIWWLTIILIVLLVSFVISRNVVRKSRNQKTL